MDRQRQTVGAHSPPRRPGALTRLRKAFCQGGMKPYRVTVHVSLKSRMKTRLLAELRGTLTISPACRRGPLCRMPPTRRRVRTHARLAWPPGFPFRGFHEDR